MSTELENFLGNDLFGAGPSSRFLNPSYRVGLNFYPLDFSPGSSFWEFVGSRPTDRARHVDWNPLKMSGGGGDASVVRFTWDKQMGSPSAQWMATIKETPGGIDWRAQEIIDGDWVDLAVLRNGILVPLGRGVVDSVREVTHSAGGATVRLWNVSGRDHGAFFELPITWTSFYAQTLSELAGGLLTKEVRGEQGGRPDKLFTMLVEAAMAPGKLGGMYDLPPSLAEKYPGKKRLFDLMRLLPLAASKRERTEGLRGMYYNAPRLWSEPGQTLHQTLTLWSNSVLNEVYYDLLPTATFMPENGLNAFFVQPPVPDPRFAGGANPGAAGSTPLASKYTTTTKDAFGEIAAYIRERPFPNTIEGSGSLWFALPTWTVPSWLIESADLGYGGHERFNIFELNVELGLAGSNPQVPMLKPMWNRDSIKKWGVRPFQQTTPFYAKETQELYKERRKWLRLLVDWYAAAPYLRQGQITFRVGLPEVRIGQRLIIDPGLGADQREQFYVEGVRHNWTWPPGSMSTIVTVTHGFRGTDRDYLSRVSSLSALYDDVQEATLLATPPKKKASPSTLPEPTNDPGDW